MTAAIFGTEVGACSPAALLPSFEVRLGDARADRAVYLRRRLVVGLVFLALCTVIGVSAQSVLADHGGVPASTPVVLPAMPGTPPIAAGARPVAQPAAGARLPYLVQPGDTIWSIAQIWHGQRGLADYVEQLVEINGGASLQAGQLLTLP